jgi:hypothetical protein
MPPVVPPIIIPTTAPRAPVGPANTKNVFEIPTGGAPLRERISLGGTVYQLTFTWCSPASSWTLDVYDDNGSLIAGGLPLVTGVDLLGQLHHLGIGGIGLNTSMVVQSDHDPNVVPDFNSLGVTGHLFYVVPVP